MRKNFQKLIAVLTMKLDLIILVFDAHQFEAIIPGTTKDIKYQPDSDNIIDPSFEEETFKAIDNEGFTYLLAAAVNEIKAT